MTNSVSQSLKRNRVIPVAVFNSSDDALRIAEMLLGNSIDVIEITIRTAAALEAIKKVKAAFPEMVVGAGSVLDRENLKKAAEAGAVFGVAPCLDDDVVECAGSLGLPFIPGISTPSELNRALKASSFIKVFPAQQLGGPDYIQSIIAPFRMREFHLMPTGGVNEKNYLSYLGVERVASCGMTYMVDSKLIDKKDFSTIGARMKQIVEGLP